MKNFADKHILQFSWKLPRKFVEKHYLHFCDQLTIRRNKFGVKAVMGRTNVGPFAFATGSNNVIRRLYTRWCLTGQGLEHWQQMTREMGAEVTKWHKMIPNTSWLLFKHDRKLCKDPALSDQWSGCDKGSCNNYVIHFCCMEQVWKSKLYQLFCIFIRQYFGPESLDTTIQN